MGCAGSREPRKTQFDGAHNRADNTGEPRTPIVRGVTMGRTIDVADVGNPKVTPPKMPALYDAPQHPATPQRQSPLSPGNAAAGFPRGRSQDNLRSPGKPLETTDMAEPHYLLDEQMQSGAYLSRMKQRQGHHGAIMLANAVHTYTVGLVGPTGAGKTHLLYTLINGEADEPVETEEPRQEVLYVTKGLEGGARVNFSIVDTCGKKGVKGVAKEYGFDGVVLAVPLDSTAVQVEEVRLILAGLLEGRGAQEAPFPVLLLGTKRDAPNARRMSELEEMLSFPGVLKGHPHAAATASLKDEAGHRAAARGMFRLAQLLLSEPSIVPSLSSPKRKPSRPNINHMRDPSFENS